MKDDTFSLVSKLNDLMSEMIIEEMKNIGLTGFSPSYGKIFLALKDRTKVTMSELSKIINKKPQTVTTLVTNLEKKGFITTEHSAIDKRTKYVRITQKGQGVIPKLDLISEKLYQQQYKEMSNEEIKVIRNLLMKMITHFEN